MEDSDKKIEAPVTQAGKYETLIKTVLELHSENTAAWKEILSDVFHGNLPQAEREESKEDSPIPNKEKKLSPQEKNTALYFAALTGNLTPLNCSDTTQLTREEKFAWRQAVIQPQLKGQKEEIKITSIGLAAERGDIDVLIRMREKCLYAYPEWWEVMNAPCCEEDSPSTPIGLLTQYLLSARSDAIPAEQFLKIAAVVQEYAPPMDPKSAPIDQIKIAAEIALKTAKHLFDTHQFTAVEEITKKVDEFIKILAKKKVENIHLLQKELVSLTSKLKDIKKQARVSKKPNIKNPVKSLAEDFDEDGDAEKTFSEDDIKNQLRDAAILYYLKKFEDTHPVLNDEKLKKDILSFPTLLFEHTDFLYTSKYTNECLAILLGAAKQWRAQPNNRYHAIKAYENAASVILRHYNDKSDTNPQTVSSHPQLEEKANLVKAPVNTRTKGSPAYIYCNALFFTAHLMKNLLTCAKNLVKLGHAERALEIYRDIKTISSKTISIHEALIRRIGEEQRQNFDNTLRQLEDHQNTATRILLTEKKPNPPEEKQKTVILNPISTSTNLEQLWADAEKQFNHNHWSHATEIYRQWEKALLSKKMGKHLSETVTVEKTQTKNETEDRTKMSLQRQAVCFFNLVADTLIPSSKIGYIFDTFSFQVQKKKFERLNKPENPDQPSHPSIENGSEEVKQDAGKTKERERSLFHNALISCGNLVHQALADGFLSSDAILQHLTLLQLIFIFSDQSSKEDLKEYLHISKCLPDNFHAHFGLALVYYLQGISKEGNTPDTATLQTAQKIVNSAVKKAKTALERATAYSLLSSILKELEALSGEKTSPGWLKTTSSSTRQKAIKEYSNAQVEKTLSQEQQSAIIIELTRLSAPASTAQMQEDKKYRGFLWLVNTGLIKKPAAYLPITPTQAVLIPESGALPTIQVSEPEFQTRQFNPHAPPKNNATQGKNNRTTPDKNEENKDGLSELPTTQRKPIWRFGHPSLFTFIRPRRENTSSRTVVKNSSSEHARKTRLSKEVRRRRSTPASLDNFSPLDESPRRQSALEVGGDQHAELKIAIDNHVKLIQNRQPIKGEKSFEILRKKFGEGLRQYDAYLTRDFYFYFGKGLLNILALERLCLTPKIFKKESERYKAKSELVFYLENAISLLEKALALAPSNHQKAVTQHALANAYAYYCDELKLPSGEYLPSISNTREINKPQNKKKSDGAKQEAEKLYNTLSKKSETNIHKEASLLLHEKLLGNQPKPPIYIEHPIDPDVHLHLLMLFSIDLVDVSTVTQAIREEDKQEDDGSSPQLSTASKTASGSLISMLATTPVTTPVKNPNETRDVLDTPRNRDEVDKESLTTATARRLAHEMADVLSEEAATQQSNSPENTQNSAEKNNVLLISSATHNEDLEQKKDPGQKRRQGREAGVALTIRPSRKAQESFASTAAADNPPAENQPRNNAPWGDNPAANIEALGTLTNQHRKRHNNPPVAVNPQSPAAKETEQATENPYVRTSVTDLIKRFGGTP